MFLNIMDLKNYKFDKPEKKIIKALKYQDIGTIVSLLNNGKMNPNQMFREMGVAPIHLAVGYGTEAGAAQSIYQLLRHGGNPNLPSEDGVTPVHVASSWGRTTILHLLLLYGGDPWKQDHDNRNAFNYAFEERAWAVLEMLHNFQLTKASSFKISRINLTKSPPETLDYVPNEVHGEGDAFLDNLKTICNYSKDNLTESKSNSVCKKKDATFTVDIPHSTLERFNISGFSESSVDEPNLYAQINDNGSTNTYSELTSIESFENAPEADLKHDQLPSRSEVFSNKTYIVDPLFINDELQSNKYNFSNERECVSSSKTDENNATASVPAPVFCNTLHLDLNKKYTIDTNSVEKEGIHMSEIKVKQERISSDENDCSFSTNKVVMLNSCQKKVIWFEEKIKVENEEVTKPEKCNVDLNKTFMIKPSVDIRADLFAELSVAVMRRSRRMATIDDPMHIENLINKHERRSSLPIRQEIEESGKKNASSASTPAKSPAKTDTTCDDSFLSVETSKVADSSLEINDKTYSLRPPASPVDNDMYHSCLDETLERDTEKIDDDEKLRQKLLEYGKSIGPVTDSTRVVYEKLLQRLGNGKVKSKSPRKPYSSPRDNAKQIIKPPPPPAPSNGGRPSQHDVHFTWQFCPELTAVMESDDPTIPYEKLEEIVQKDFSEPWQLRRGGNAKTCFNYLLLDQRVTKDLPARSTSMVLSEVTRIFLDAIFYVGKGQAGRPYTHLQNAASLWKTRSIPTEPKSAHIFSIWRSGFGVVCLHLFHNTSTVEALTREAAMIDALGRSKLRNLKRGEYYGHAARWTLGDRRRLGVRLLMKARDILMKEGERAIRPEDL